MSLFERIKRFLSVQDDKKEEKIEKDVDQKDGTFVEQKQEIIQTPENIPPKQITVENTFHAIQSWENTLEAAKQHPLSQVKVLNTQILEELTNVLKNMDAKLNRLDKLDEILGILNQTKQDLTEKGVDSSGIDKAIEEIERLTIKDKEVISWIAKQERVTAKQLADYIGLSRSTASFRLNRLAELGALDKEAIGKKIYYKPKTI